MARYCSLYSGSKGNCYYIGSSGRGLIIDAGVSCKSVVTALKNNNIDLSTIDGILITHEHSDHIKGLKPIINYFKCPVYSTKDTLEYLTEKGKIPSDAQTEVIKDNMSIGTFKVKSFPTPHDCYSSTGYRFTASDNTIITHVTDLGHVTETVESNLKGSDMVILESNYDPNLLKISSYPYYLKQRIKSNHGHLSNNQCAEEVLKLVKNGTSRIMLAHLSRENNNPTLAKQTTADILEKNGFKKDIDYMLYIAGADTPSELIII